MCNRVFREVLSAILIVVFAVSILPVTPVYAATEDRTVSGEGTDNTFVTESYVGGATNYTVLNSDDGDTSYWNATTNAAGYKYHSWQITDTAISGTITNVRLTSKLRSPAGTQTARLYTYIGAARYEGSDNSIIAPNPITITKDWATNPSTGAAWSIAEVNSAEFGMGLSTGVAYAYTTYMYLTITYTATSLPTTTTSAASYTLVTTSQQNGTVSSTGGATIDARGFVWDTTSRADPGNVAPNATAYANNYTEYGAWGAESFSYNATGLVTGTTYYTRAAAHNSVGWDYGDEISFTTVGTPSVNTVAASSVASSTARINALIVDASNQACDIRFGYDTVTHSANFSAYSNITAWTYNTYTTGQTPYVDLSSLATGTPYFFNVQIQNDAATTTGTELTFTTTSGVGEPSNFVAIPSTTTVSLIWSKGTGTTNTYVRFKIGSYPTSTTDGTLIYSSTQSSYQHTGLTPGTTYYYKAWGESGAVYSTGNVTTLCTTLPATASSTTTAAPDTPAEWWQAPNYANMAGLPIYDMVNWTLDTMTLPLATGWFLLYLMFVTLILAIIYRWTEKMPVAIICGVVLILVGSFMGLVSMFLSLPFTAIAIGTFVVGQRG